MGMKEKKRIPTSGEPIRWKSPFAALKSAGLPPASDVRPYTDRPDPAPTAPKKNRGRVDIIRQTAHRESISLAVPLKGQNSDRIVVLKKRRTVNRLIEGSLAIGG